MDRQDYPGLLQKLQPTQAVDVLTDRVTQIKRLNYTIADWLQERTRLEEQYAAGLRKLARKQIGDEDLGIFSVPWGTLLSSMEALAESHSTLGTKIEVDVEKPLRDYASSNREMQQMPTIQGNLGSLARDVDKAQKATDKLEGKGESADATKVVNATQDLEHARSQWLGQAPYVFEGLQKLDEDRVNQLRDSLTQFVTLEVDQVEKSRVAAEQALNVLLNLETADEIKTFALKAAAHRPSESRPSNRASMFVGGSTPARGGGSASGLTPIQSNPDDAASHASSSKPLPQKKGFTGGLKRIGTVMSRRSSKQPQQLDVTDESPGPERKPKSSPFGRLGRNKSSYSGTIPEDAEPAQRPQSPLRRGSEALEPPQTQESSTSASRAPQLGPIPYINGAGSGPTGASSTFAPAFANGSHQSDLADLEPPKPLQPTAAAAPTFADARRDNDGFSVPPQRLDPISQAQADAGDLGDRQDPQFNVNIRDAPIQEEGGEVALASMANKLAPPPSQRRAGTVRGRRDARNSAIVSTYGAPDGFSSETANAPSTIDRSHPTTTAPLTTDPQTVASRAVEPPAQSFPAPSAAGLAPSPSGAFSPIGAGQTAFAPFSPVSEPQSPTQAPRAAPLAADVTGDNHSIRSGRSLQSSASLAQKHPVLTQPRLNCSIIETVSAKYDSSGLASSSVIGEIAFMYNSTGVGSPEQKAIRLESFAALDKVAPNPAFVAQLQTGDPGEYLLTLADLTRTTLGFKYQARSDTSDKQSQVPLLLAPVLKIEPAQTSIIVNYSLYPSFRTLLGGESVTLRNVTIALTLEGAKATSCQSKPVGTFAREKNLIFWQLPEITLRAGTEPGKLLARFVTEGPATGSHVEGKWELTGEDAHGVGSRIVVQEHEASAGSDPFADETAATGEFVRVPTVKKVISGSYIAKS